MFRSYPGYIQPYTRARADSTLSREVEEGRSGQRTASSNALNMMNRTAQRLAVAMTVRMMNQIMDVFSREFSG